MKNLTLALLAILLSFIVSAWERIKFEPRNWPSVWKLVAGLLGALTAGLIMLNAVGLLDDFLLIFQ